jgi:hypothetical protein
MATPDAVRDLTASVDSLVATIRAYQADTNGLMVGIVSALFLVLRTLDRPDDAGTRRIRIVLQARLREMSEEERLQPSNIPLATLLSFLESPPEGPPA